MTHGKEHEYRSQLTWESDRVEGPFDYKSYTRNFRVSMPGKADLLGSADPAFRGDPSRHNPEELLVAALSSCHMLSYLALCARKGIKVMRYSDDASGVMSTRPDGSGAFESVTLRPRVEVAEEGMRSEAMALHEAAHTYCFVSSSVNFPVGYEAEVEVTPS